MHASYIYLHACMHMCILHYIISCAYITKRLHYSCCDITISSHPLAGLQRQCWVEVELALGILTKIIINSVDSKHH